MKEEINEALRKYKGIVNTFSRGKVANYMLEGMELEQAACLVSTEVRILKQMINQEEE